MREGKSHRKYKAIFGEVQMLYWDVNRQRCCSGAFEHDCGPFWWAKQNVRPQERALKSGIAPGPAYVADLKTSGGMAGKLDVGAFGMMDKDEDVCEQDVWKTRDRGEGITIGLEGLNMTRVEGLRYLTVEIVESGVHCLMESATISASAQSQK
jgi:hypothetical protein